jgi:predicted methyltransferase
MKKLMIALLALGLVACSSSQPAEDDQPTEEPAETAEETTDEEEAEPQSIEEMIEAAATGVHRSPDNIARNEHRNPVETLMFFGIEPDMTVVELWPGSGWYTEVLAPVLTDGQLVAASFAPKPDEPDHYRNRVFNEYDARLQNEEVFANVRHGMLQPPEKVDIGEDASADMVVTFRNFHSFIGAEIEDEVVAHAYRVLKPGGVFGVVQHRADEGADVKETAESGYVPEAYVIETAEAAGFELVERSDINANPADTKDHPEGVWTLPPSYRLGDEDREKYEAIGESDRMTLKFRKPADDAGSDGADVDGDDGA